MACLPSFVVCSSLQASWASVARTEGSNGSFLAFFLGFRFFLLWPSPAFFSAREAPSFCIASGVLASWRGESSAALVIWPTAVTLYALK